MTQIQLRVLIRVIEACGFSPHGHTSPSWLGYPMIQFLYRAKTPVHPFPKLPSRLRSCSHLTWRRKPGKSTSPDIAKVSNIIIPLASWRSSTLTRLPIEVARRASIAPVHEVVFEHTELVQFDGGVTHSRRLAAFLGVVSCLQKRYIPHGMGRYALENEECGFCSVSWNEKWRGCVVGN